MTSDTTKPERPLGVGRLSLRFADEPKAPASTRIKQARFSGDFLIYRNEASATGEGKVRRRPEGGWRVRHKQWGGAVAEAERMLTTEPGGTVLIMQEVGTVKLRPTEAAA